jgi:hypothetical protein
MTETRGDARKAPSEFSLLGGPSHRLGRRLGLVRGDANTVRLGLVLGGGMWLILIIVTLVDGRPDLIISLSVIGVSARLLVVIPLIFMCESWVVPRMAAFVRRITGSGIVPAGKRSTPTGPPSRTFR